MWRTSTSFMDYRSWCDSGTITDSNISSQGGRSQVLADFLNHVCFCSLLTAGSKCPSQPWGFASPTDWQALNFYAYTTSLRSSYFYYCCRVQRHKPRVKASKVQPSTCSSGLDSELLVTSRFMNTVTSDLSVEGGRMQKRKNFTLRDQFCITFSFSLEGQRHLSRLKQTRH